MNKRKLFGLLLFFVLVLIAGFQQPVYAQDPQPTPSDDEVNRVAKQMFCPVCENIPLDVCPTQACSEWRELIRLRLSEGWSDQQIKDYFAAQYGDRVLAEPPRRGLNWLIYILPAVFFLAGVLILWKVLNGMKSKTGAVRVEQASARINPETDDERYLRELEEQLKKQD